MRKLVFCLLVIFTFCSKQSRAQYQASWLMDNYAGINSVTLNPALPGSFPLSWDLNLGSASVYVENNYGYLEERSLFDFYKNRKDLEFKLSKDLEGLVEDFDFIFEYFDDRKIRKASLLVDVMGPSVFFKINKKHQAGIFTGMHTVFGTQKVPQSLSFYSYSETQFDTPIPIKPFSGAIMAWGEAGVNYGYNTAFPTGKLTVSVNVKYLQGLEALYLGLNSNALVTKIEGDSISGTNADLSFGYASSLVESLPEVKPEVNGTGFGIDIGFIYHNDSEAPKKLYDYKVGASLINLGSINFQKNTFAHNVEVNDLQKIAWVDYKDLNGLASVDDAIQIFSEQSLGHPDSSLISNDFRAYLPASLNLHGDISLMPYLFVSASLVQPLMLGAIQPQIGSQFLVTPRFEHRWFGAYLPVAVTNWEEINIGFGARIGYLFLGTENLKSVFIPSNFTGSEVFVGLKFNPFRIGDGFKSKKRSVRGIKCFNF